MGKVPVRLREVVYTLSPFEQTVMNGVVKDLPAKIHRKFAEVRIVRSAVLPSALAAVINLSFRYCRTGWTWECSLLPLLRPPSRE